MPCKCGNDLFEIDYISTSYGQCIVDGDGDVRSIHEKGSEGFDFDGEYECIKCRKIYGELPED
jgi:hypothetical protein